MSEIVTKLPDGSAFFTAELPLPKDHWIYSAGAGEPPAKCRLGTDNPLRKILEPILRDAAKWAIGASTESGTLKDFDPDALSQNFIMAVIGPWTPDGTSQTSELSELTHTDRLAALEDEIAEIKRSLGR